MTFFIFIIKFVDLSNKRETIKLKKKVLRRISICAKRRKYQNLFYVTFLRFNSSTNCVSILFKNSLFTELQRFKIKVTKDYRKKKEE